MSTQPATHLETLLTIAQNAKLDIANANSIYNKNHNTLTQEQEEKIFEILNSVRSTVFASSKEEDIHKTLISVVNTILIFANIRLIYWAMKSLRGHYENDEILQEGVLALQRAIDKFDSNKQVRFSTYATYWLKEANIRLFKEKFPKSHSLQEQKAQESEFEQEFLYSSIHETIYLPFDDELCVDSTASSQLSLLEDEERRHIVLAALDQLTPLEKKIMLFTYGFLEEEIQDNVQLAHSLGVTLPDVYKAIRSAKSKLKNYPHLKDIYDL